MEDSLKIDQDTRIFGVIGHPLEHSWSPAMHNAAFEAAGINAVYLPFRIEPQRLPSLLDSVRTLNIKGFNVTIPYKERIIPYLDEISRDARACRSVNVVKIDRGRALGFTTDGPGFLSALDDEEIKPRGTAIVLGAGGAARSIGFSLAGTGCELVFVNRSMERAETLSADISRCGGATARALAWTDPGLEEFLKRADLVVNTTPVGMYPEVGVSPPLDLRWVNPAATVCDIVYNPLNTLFLREAGKLGFKTVNGLGMLLNQGALSWPIWLEREAPKRVMRDVLQNQMREN
jgi:shikimate dehydrogenase